MVIRMQTILKNPIIKLGTALLFELSLILCFLVQAGQASPLYQTIPTAPPPTEINPTLSPTLIPTRIPPITALPTQPPMVTSTQTALFTASPVIVSTQTGIPDQGTLPSLTATQSSTMQIQISPTATLEPTSEISVPLISEILSNTTYCLFGGLLIILIVVGLFLILRNRRKENQ